MLLFVISLRNKPLVGMSEGWGIHAVEYAADDA